MAEREPVPMLKNDFEEMSEGSIDLSHGVTAALEDMATGYAAALGTERNMGIRRIPKPPSSRP